MEIRNEARYEAGREASIRNNKRIGNERRWIAESGAAVVEQCKAALAHDTTNTFVRSMQEALANWGRLTPAQEKAVLGMAERAAARKAEFAAKDAASAHVGKVGERTTFALTINWVKGFEGHFGVTYIHGLRDAANNILIYKGSNHLGAKGEHLTLKATIKEHGTREGVAQTIIARPAVL
jgi:hypothetical protein